jgi:DNA segregation ATPase FtsK/SpoIIIE, S-DNA-T family
MANLIRLVKAILTLPRSVLTGTASVVSGAWLLRLLWRFKTLVTLTLVVLLTYSAYGWVGLVLLAVLPPAFSLAWRWAHPVSYWWAMRRLVGRVRRRFVYGPRWDTVTKACGLHKPSPMDGGDSVAPLLRRVMLGPIGDVLDVRMLDGQIPDDYTRRAADLAHAFGVREVHVTSPGPGRVVLTVATKDPLAEPIHLEQMPAATDLRAVRFAVGEDGEWRTRNYANVAAEVGGGVPGSGKTAGERSLACSLIQHPSVQYVVIDGKGGSDWSWIAPRAAIYCPEDDNLAAVLTAVQTVVDVMRHRLKSQLQERGSAEFWDLPLTPEHPVIVVTVDEVQTFTETKAIPDPEAKALAGQITAALAVLVKKGRSAGIVTRLLTQKPTSDSLPTTIRDNASVRTSWRVMSRQAAEAILGPVVNESAITPVDIPESRPGTAVVATDTGALERVRYPFVEAVTATAIAAETASYRRDLTGMAGTADEHDDQADNPAPGAAADGDPVTEGVSA